MPIVSVWFGIVVLSILNVWLCSCFPGTLETAIHFVIYEHVKKMMAINDQRELELTECMLAAATAKMTASSLCYPHGESPSPPPPLSPIAPQLPPSPSPPSLSLSHRGVQNTAKAECE